MAMETNGERTGIFNAVIAAMALVLYLACQAFPLLGGLERAWSLAFPARRSKN
jgi:hypothetical protein